MVNLRYKFRGYATEKMIDNQWLYGFGVMSVDYVDGTKEYLLYTMRGAYKVVPVSIGQFTGLFDKNGKEIYEGDIVASAGTELIFQVVYEGSSFCRKWVDGVSKKYRYPVEPMAWNTHIICEVIGNIYQNPELLECIDK